MRMVTLVIWFDTLKWRRHQKWTRNRTIDVLSSIARTNRSLVVNCFIKTPDLCNALFITAVSQPKWVRTTLDDCATSLFCRVVSAIVISSRSRAQITHTTKINMTNDSCFLSFWFLYCMYDHCTCLLFAQEPLLSSCKGPTAHSCYYNIITK